MGESRQFSTLTREADPSETPVPITPVVSGRNPRRVDTGDPNRHPCRHDTQGSQRRRLPAGHVEEVDVGPPEEGVGYGRGRPAQTPRGEVGIAAPAASESRPTPGSPSSFPTPGPRVVPLRPHVPLPPERSPGVSRALGGGSDGGSLRGTRSGSSVAAREGGAV